MKELILMSMQSQNVEEIKNKVREYEYRRSPIKKRDIGKKIYIYSAKDEKSIVGYIIISEVLEGTTKEIIEKTTNNNKVKYDIANYFGIDNEKCYAMKIEEFIEFEKYIQLYDIKLVDKNFIPPQYYTYIKNKEPNNKIYNLITNWDEQYSIKELNTNKKTR